MGGAWWATVYGVDKLLDTTKQLTHTHTHTHTHTQPAFLTASSEPVSGPTQALTETHWEAVILFTWFTEKPQIEGGWQGLEGQETSALGALK